MSYNFQKEVEKLHKKEIKSLHEEIEKNNGDYYEMAKREGFDNISDYEFKTLMRLSFIFVTGLLLCVSLIIVTLLSYALNI